MLCTYHAFHSFNPPIIPFYILARFSGKLFSTFHYFIYFVPVITIFIISQLNIPRRKTRNRAFINKKNFFTFVPYLKLFNGLNNCKAKIP